MVGAYVGGMVLRAAQAAGDPVKQNQAAVDDQAAAKVFMAVIAGRDPAYAPMGSWNAGEEGGLKSWVRHVLRKVVHPGMLAKPDGPYEAVAAYLMDRTYTTLGELRDGVTEEELSAAVQDIVKDGVRLVLGIPDPLPPQDS